MSNVHTNTIEGYFSIFKAALGGIVGKRLTCRDSSLTA